MKTSSYQQALLKAMKKFLDKDFFAAIDSKGKSRWPSHYIVLMALLMSYTESQFLSDAFQRARGVLIKMFPQRRRPGSTYQGFIKARRAWTAKHQGQLMNHLQTKQKQIAGKHWQRQGWVAFAVDGTGLALTRTQSNLDSFGTAGHTKAGPQMALTTLYHMGTGLPWAWQQGPVSQGERTQLRQLLPSLPENSLLVADAGFTGYELFCELQSQKIDFLIRVGSNMNLLQDLDMNIEKNGQQLWLWPTAKRNKKPIRLRLIHLKNKSGTDVFLVTNVLDDQKLSDETAGVFYKMRWGVEVFFRGFKQTFDKHKLRSKAPAQVEDELFWAMTSMLLLGLMTVSAIIQAKKDPLSLSVALALREVRQSMTNSNRWRRKNDLLILLRDAIRDNYKRSKPKASHDYPRKKRESPPSPPTIRAASTAEKQRFQAILLSA